jgi:hypothetical protein
MLNEKLNEATASAALEATTARNAYQMVALSVLEGTTPPKDLERAAQAVKEADQRVANANAAREAAEVRQARLDEEARVRAATAHAAAIQEQLGKIEQAAAKWDQALDALVAAAVDYGAHSKRLYALQPGQPTISRLENARSMAMQIIGFRLAAFVGEGHRPPFFPESYGRLTYHIPKAAE